jgi:hypothetical protein
MKMLAEIAAVAILVPLIATAQDAARDIARQMGANTATSVSQGLDRHDIHQDTEIVERPQQHVPNLLQSVQGSNGKKLSKAQKKNLVQRRNALLKDRKATVDRAAEQTQKAKENASASFMANKKASASAMATSKMSMNEARRNAECDWNAKRGKELQAIDRALHEGTEDTEVRLHAPSLVNPK